MSTPRAPGIRAPIGDAIAVMVVVLLAVFPFPDDLSRAHGPLLVVALLPAVAMPFRRRWPIAALGVSLACNLVLALSGVLAPSTLFAVAITSFSVADRSRRLVGALCVGAATLIVFLSNALPLGGNFFDSLAMQFVMFTLLAGALGDAARSRREYALAMKERAERAEQDRDEEARRRVAEERVRIARDLHDVVAHQISVISLNAGVASSSLETRPERARESLTTIRSASRTILTDIGALMALLRADVGEEQDYLHPQVGLAGLDELVERFGAVGLAVTLDREPSIPVLTPASDHVAFLALQEGLTNAHKHGSDSAIVRVGSTGDSVHLSVTNPLATRAGEAATSGQGLRGLRERVAAVRGRVETSRIDGEFRLDVWLPGEGKRS